MSGKSPFLQFVYLSQHEALHLVEALPLLGRSHQEEGPVVVQQFSTSCCALHLHRLVQVEVEESGPSVAQHVLHQFEGVGLQGVGLLGAPAHPYLLCLLSDDGRVLGLCQRGQWCEDGLPHVGTGLPTAEVCVDDGDGLVGVEVTGHADGYVVGAVPLVEVVLDVDNRGVLQVLLRADRGLRAVGMVGPEHLADAVEQFAGV